MDSDTSGSGPSVVMSTSTSLVGSMSQNAPDSHRPSACASGSRSYSPHFIPDRITRHASPSRQDLAQQEVSIVPRIPQPYRTSFSAVTSPLRIPKVTTSELTIPPAPINLLGVRKRTTSPGRIKPLTCQQVAETSSKTNNYGNAMQLQRSKYPDVVQDCSQFSLNCDIKSSTVDASLPQDTQRPCQPDKMRGLMTSESLSLESVLDIKKPADFSIVPDDSTDMQSTTETFSLKPMKEKFGNAKQAGHFQHFGKFKSFRSDGESTRRSVYEASQKTSQKIINDKSKDTEPASEANEIRERSKTLPSEAILADGSANLEKNQKSLSMSIASFFRKMSPKSLRRLANNAEKCDQNNHGIGISAANSLVEFTGINTISGIGTSRAVGGSIVADTDVVISNDSVLPFEKTRHSRSLKKNPRMLSVKRLFISRSKQRVSDGSSAERHMEKIQVGRVDPGKGDSISGQPMTPEMTLILKSIEDNSAKVHQKSVYQTFKEKRSPVMTTESAFGLKPHVLQAVEFPDNILQSDLGGTNATSVSSSLPELPDDVGDGVSIILCCNTEPADCLAVREGQKRKTSRRHDPPHTLNVQAVQKVGKRMFQFPSMSVESIGQCSLDFIDAVKRREADVKNLRGSEASLVQNGHFSSVSASKRTLTSEDNLAEQASKSSLQATDSSSSLVHIDDTACNTSELTDIEPRALPPSYLKLSRAVGGYTPYNTYVSKAEHERLGAEQNISRNRADKQHKDTEVVLQNGDTIVTLQKPHPTYGSTEQNSHFVVEDVGGVPVYGGTSSSGYASTVSDSVRGIVAQVPESGLSPSSAFTSSDAVLTSQDVPSLKSLPQVILEGCNESLSVSRKGNGATTKRSSHPPFTHSSDSEGEFKDGRYFLNLVDTVELHLKQQCDKTEKDLLAETSDEAEGIMRAAVGKANLLIKKKFPRFRQLCHANLDDRDDEPFKTTEQDLSGFWDIVLIQVEDVDKQFDAIEKLHQAGWKEIQSTPLESLATPVTRCSGMKMKTHKSNPMANVKSSSSSSSAAAIKAREDARRRLMAAKAAGRQRKASESDKDVEIFVS